MDSLLFTVVVAFVISFNGEVESETLLPFAPSIKDLPKMKAFQINGPEFKMDCKLNMVNIPSVKYYWFFSKDKNDEGELLRNDNDGSYTIRGPTLTLDSHWKTWQDLMGYYWCRASNQFGDSTSSKIQVVTTTQRQQEQETLEKTVRFGESTRVEFGFPPLRDTDLPVQISFAIKESDEGSSRLLEREDKNFKDGRFVIGSNGDLYVIEPKPSDSCTIQQQYREYSTNNNFIYKVVEFQVETVQSNGENKGFFDDMPTTYLFVRGKPAFFTCIPKEKRTVLLRKDGYQFTLPYMESNVNKNPVYRTEFTVHFDSPTEDDTAKYTCYFGSQDSIDYEVKVIGPPKIACIQDDLIIRAPEENVLIQCQISSDFMTLQKPRIIVNGTLEIYEMSQIRGFTMEVLGPDSKGEYTVRIEGSKLDMYDSTVFRIEVDADEMSKNQVLDKQGLLSLYQNNKVLFNDFTVLDFKARREIILSVLSKKPTIIDPAAGSSVLVGTKNFEIKFIIFGSPVPHVTWYKNNSPVYAGMDYSMKKFNDLYFSLFIKEVKGSAKYIVNAENVLSGGQPISHEYELKAHEPLELSNLIEHEYFTIVSKPLDVVCAARQMNGAQTMTIDFLWFLDEVQMVPTPSNDVKVTEYKDDSGFTVNTLTFRPWKDIHYVKCRAALGRLDNRTLSIRVITGEAPEPPINLEFNGDMFSWQSQRQKKFVKDVLEWVPYFAESDASSTDRFKVYDETTNSLPIGNGGPYVSVELKKLTAPEKQFKPGVKYGFRAKTLNTYGASEYSETIYYRISDAVPTKMIEHLNVQPDSSDASKVYVSWDLYPREQYNSFSPVGCCIHLVLKAEGRTIREDCVDPSKRGLSIGWQDTAPYTQHFAEAWFSNQLGEVEDHSSTYGYNSAAAPTIYPVVKEQKASMEARKISVTYDAMTEDQINGKFLAYKLEVFDDETGALVGEVLDRELGDPNTERTMTVEGLDPYTWYKVVISVLNDEFSTSSPPWRHRTYAARPSKIPTSNITVHQWPSAVFAFWSAPENMNGEFLQYNTETIPLTSSSSGVPAMLKNATEDTQLDLTEYFFPSKVGGVQKPYNSRYSFGVATSNTLFTSDKTITSFTLEDTFNKVPLAPLPPYVDCVSPAFNLTIWWDFKQFGRYAATHYITYTASGASESQESEGLSEGEQDLCQYVAVDAGMDAQMCVLQVAPHATAYDIRLVARNKNGETQSPSVHCTSRAPEKQTGGNVRAANVPLFFAFLALILLIVVASLGVVYWRKNRSHPYRVREQEMKFRPKDAQSWPRKDDTNRFDDFHPDFFGKEPVWDLYSPRTPLMPSTPRPAGSRIDLDNDSYDDDEDMLGGFDEDGSFLEAYGRAAMEPPLDLNTAV